MLSIPASLLGTIPGWITSAGVVALVIGFFKYRIGMRTLDDASEEKIRTHYSSELERVVTLQRECEERSHQQQVEFDKREKELRDRVTKLEDDILGLIRIIGQASSDKVLMLEPEAPEDIRNIAHRIIEGRYKS